MVHDSHSNHTVQRKVGTGKHRTVDMFAYVLGILGPLMTMSQSYLIWSTKSATNLSILSWGTYLLMAIAWFVYGIVHKEKLMIFSNIIWIFAHASVVLGIIVFR